MQLELFSFCPTAPCWINTHEICGNTADECDDVNKPGKEKHPTLMTIWKKVKLMKMRWVKIHEKIFSPKLLVHHSSHHHFLLLWGQGLATQASLSGLTTKVQKWEQPSHVFHQSTYCNCDFFDVLSHLVWNLLVFWGLLRCLSTAAILSTGPWSDLHSERLRKSTTCHIKNSWHKLVQHFAQHFVLPDFSWNLL